MKCSFERCTHIHCDSGEGEELGGGLVPGDVPEELIAIFVPLDGVEGFPLQVEVTLQSGAVVTHRVHRDSNLVQSQTEYT